MCQQWCTCDPFNRQQMIKNLCFQIVDNDSREMRIIEGQVTDGNTYKQKLADQKFSKEDAKKKNNVWNFP